MSTNVKQLIPTRLRHWYWAARGRYHDTWRRVAFVLRARRRRVSLSQILMGGESAHTGEAFARLTADPLRPSTPISQSPHVELLMLWDQLGAALFREEVFHTTRYYRNALLNIDLFGSYFDATSEHAIVDGARRFVGCYVGDTHERLPSQRGQSGPREAIHLRPIKHSDCFQVVDGHHRLAIAHMHGRRDVMAVVEQRAVLTPIQRMLLNVMWIQGRKELYQPIDVPEIRKE